MDAPARKNPSGARRKPRRGKPSRPNQSRAAARQQAEALGLRWEIGEDDERDDEHHPDWEAIAVALDALEAGDRSGAEAILPKGVRIEGVGAKATITDLPDEPPLVRWLKGDIDSVFGIKTRWGGEPAVDLDDAGQFHWSDLDPASASDKSDIRRHPENYVYLPRLLAFGDYDNSGAVERSNQRVFLEMFGERPGVYEIYGSHGSQAVAIRLTVEDDDEELTRTLSGLEDYPLIDEDDMSNLEQEMYQEAFNDWGLRDFVNELERHHNIDIDADAISGNGETGEANIGTYIFWEALGATSGGAQVESGGGVYFPLKEMAAEVELHQLDDAGVSYTPRD